MWLFATAHAGELGLTVGDVQAEHALIWAQGEGAGVVRLRLDDGRHARVLEGLAEAEHDYTVHLVAERLRADTVYTVDVISGATPARATFRTPPGPHDFRPTTFAWGGDLAGQNACRDATLGYPIFPHITELHPAFFLALGDLIYADNACTSPGKFGNAQVPGPGPAPTLALFREHWRYNLSEAGWRALRAAVPIVGVWDDHEVVNDFGPEKDTRNKAPYTPGEHLLPIGLRAFREYTPLPDTLHRRLRWGEALELFVVDTRSYRSPNLAPDDASKTMLGKAQVDWLVDAVTGSDAAWKVVVSSVPLSSPTGSPESRDGWSAVGGAGGYMTELTGLLRRLVDVRDLVFVTTDVHFAAAFRYRPFADHPRFVFHELIAGPLNAGLFPHREFDPTLGAELLFFHGPASMDAVRDYEEALGWYNFGAFQVNADRSLTARWRDARGAVVGELRMPSQAR